MEKAGLEQYRYFLKDSIRKNIDFSKTGQSQGFPPPPIEKPHRNDQKTVPLLSSAGFADKYTMTLQTAIDGRQSRRKFQGVLVSFAELSFLLWATQGVRQVIDSGHALRTVPSAGARHSLETYLAISKVDGVEAGFYRYLPLSHSLLLERMDAGAVKKVERASFNQSWMAGAAVIFLWATIPKRMEWRYDLAAHRVILIDAGHVCQNLYLACEAIGAGICAVAAYDQEEMDHLLGLDGDEEFVIYTAAVGRPH